MYKEKELKSKKKSNKTKAEQPENDKKLTISGL